MSASRHQSQPLAATSPVQVYAQDHVLECNGTQSVDRSRADVVLRTENLSVCYGQALALRNVNLNVRRNTITAVIGPSGCGKSSLLAAMNRLTDLFENCHVSGHVYVDDMEVHAADVDLVALRRRVGMIFQQPNPLPTSIQKNFDLPLREHGVRSRDRRHAIMERALRDTGLWAEVKDRLRAAAPALSGGQQQRLCIARALALQPEVILLDEPCSALDPLSSGVVEDLIASLHGRYTVVIVTHNLAQARRLADDAAVVWMRDGAGELIEAGSAAQLFQCPQHELTRQYIEGIRG